MGTSRAGNCGTIGHLIATLSCNAAAAAKGTIIAAANHPANGRATPQSGDCACGEGHHLQNPITIAIVH